MHMMLMLGILTFIFFVSLLVMCLYRFHINTKLWNAIFVILDVIFFSCWTYAAYQVGWIEEAGWLTLDNISPLMFTMIILTVFMRGKAKEYVYSAIAFLSVGMFLAMLLSPEQAYLADYKAEASFVYTSEALCHMLCSLFGIYLVLSGQIKATFHNWLKSMIFLYSIISASIVLNVIYHRSYFGMDPYGSYGIYGLDIFNSWEMTIVAYYVGIALILTIGLQVVYFLERFTAKYADAILHKLYHEIHEGASHSAQSDSADAT